MARMRRRRNRRARATAVRDRNFLSGAGGREYPPPFFVSSLDGPAFPLVNERSKILIR